MLREQGGNVTTEELVNVLQGMDIETGVDPGAPAGIGNGICALPDRAAGRRAARAMRAKETSPCDSTG
jgi:hypothetical protein